MITEQHGNLLEAEADALVNTVNTVGVMGKGIALQFKRAYPENFRIYAEACNEDRVRLGEMFPVKLNAVTGPGYIINFPTKGNWRARSKIQDIRAGLENLVHVIRGLELASVALPPLGCGNGGLRWEDVYPLIREASEKIPDTHFMVFPPEGAPRAEDMPNRTDRPEMTRHRAAMMVALNRYVDSSCAAGQALEREFSLVEAQKVVYFLQLAGWSSGLEFTQGHLGPYSQALDQTLSSLEGHFLTGYGDGTGGSRALLRLDPDSVVEARQVMRGDYGFDTSLEFFDILVHGFEFPYGMELLSTVHFLMSRSVEVDPSFDQVVEGIATWSERKAQLFRPQQARVAYDHLTAVGALSSR